LESIGACVRDCRARDARGAEGEASPMPCEKAGDSAASVP
jgi:hypothetical protein